MQDQRLSLGLSCATIPFALLLAACGDASLGKGSCIRVPDCGAVKTEGLDSHPGGVITTQSPLNLEGTPLTPTWEKEVGRLAADAFPSYVGGDRYWVRLGREDKLAGLNPETGEVLEELEVDGAGDDWVSVQSSEDGPRVFLTGERDGELRRLTWPDGVEAPPNREVISAWTYRGFRTPAHVITMPDGSTYAAQRGDFSRIWHTGPEGTLLWARSDLPTIPANSFSGRWNARPLWPAPDGGLILTHFEAGQDTFAITYLEPEGGVRWRVLNRVNVEADGNDEPLAALRALVTRDGRTLVAALQGRSRDLEVTFVSPEGERLAEHRLERTTYRDAVPSSVVEDDMGRILVLTEAGGRESEDRRSVLCRFESPDAPICAPLDRSYPFHKTSQMTVVGSSLFIADPFRVARFELTSLDP